jgi:NADPH-dependent 7-cyano-7-deazaguanine reductase QueF-like protein
VATPTTGKIYNFHCRHLLLPLTFFGLPKVAISKHFIVNQAQTLIEGQSFLPWLVLSPTTSKQAQVWFSLFTPPF